jgi:hypothetical protein
MIQNLTPTQQFIQKARAQPRFEMLFLQRR